jgi:CubicO group peptidase (beta-lactamase class C family)
MKRQVLSLALLAACATPSRPTPSAVSSAPPPAAPPATSATAPAAEVRTMTADTPLTDGDGNTFVAPAEWTVTRQGAMTILSPPEGDSRIALIGVSADTSEAARDAAWKLFKPARTWPLLDTQTAPDRSGWSRWTTYNYQTSPTEHRAVQVATAFANGRWLVIVIDLDLAIAEKRGGQLGKIFDKLHPKGYSDESFAGKTAAKLDAARIDELKKFVTAAQSVTGVPGVAFGLVQDGKVVWAGGLGVRELGKPAPVDAKTLFMIASNTKALTTLMLAKLVDQKKLTWEGAATTSLPQFKLGNDEVTKQVQIKHLVCACTGMPRQDLEWLLEWKRATPSTILSSLGKMMPTSKFGELFQYSNLMAAAAGYLGGHVAFPKLELGAAYDKAMQSLVFTPLGMRSTTFDYAKALRTNHAMPYSIDLEGKPAPAPMELNYSVIPARPAGAAWSNVEDLLRYVQMELDEGALAGGKRYIGKDALLARRTPNVAVGNDGAYGMGLFLSTARGVTVVHHGGDVFGYHSDMMWLPEHGVGAVILTNGDLGPIIRDQFRRKLLEVLFGGKPEADENVATSARNSLADIATARKMFTLPAAPAHAQKLAATYKNAELGTITVVRSGGKTVFDFGELKSEVASQVNPDGTVTFTTVVPGFIGLGFVAGEAGGKPTLVIRDSQHEYVFTAP